jgi:hypothetical protein
LSARDLVASLPGCNDDLPAICTEWFEILLQERDARNQFVSTMLSYRLAMVSGYHRPCWYCRGMQGISCWADPFPEIRELIIPANKWVGGSVAAFPDPTDGLIRENYLGSGAVDEVGELLAWYENADLEERVDEEGDWAFRSALAYCIENHLSFIEVSDVYSPMAGASINVEQSVRAKHLGHG